MALKKKGFANTKVSPSLEEPSNPAILQIDQLAKMSKGYEEKNNAIAYMMNDMRRMFDEKLQALERDNKNLKEKFNFRKTTKYTKDENSSTDQRKETKEDRKTKASESDTESLENSVASSSRTVNNKKTLRHVEKINSRGKDN